MDYLKGNSMKHEGVDPWAFVEHEATLLCVVDFLESIKKSNTKEQPLRKTSCKLKIRAKRTR